jgi:hypothetical protein
MKTPYQPKKKNLMLLAIKGRVRRVENSLNRVKKKYFFLPRFCQFSIKHELHSCTWFKKGTHHLHHVGSKNE